MTRGERIHFRNGLLFASPWLVGFFVFMLYPVGASLYYSFCQYNVVTPPVWVGLENYRKMFFEDRVFWIALYNTIYYTVFTVPLSIGLSIGLAVLLNQKVAGMAAYRTIFFLPTIVPIVAASVLWLWIFNPESGLVNSVLWDTVGIQGPGWLADRHWSKPALVLMGLWGVGSAVVIFLAGLTDVPQELYEVAEIDGAGPWRKFLNVTLPMLTPTILFNLVMGLIASFQYFTQVYIMSAGTGGPVNSTMMYALYLYIQCFKYLHMGYASAMAWLLFLIVLAATMLVMASSKRWVHYHGD